MTDTLLELANIFIAYITPAALKLFPMWEARGMKTRTIIVVYSCVALFICAGFLIVKQFWSIDVGALRFFMLCASLPQILIPFLVFRKRFWQNVFLW